MNARAFSGIRSGSSFPQQALSEFRRNKKSTSPRLSRRWCQRSNLPRIATVWSRCETSGGRVLSGRYPGVTAAHALIWSSDGMGCEGFVEMAYRLPRIGAAGGCGPRRQEIHRQFPASILTVLWRFAANGPTRENRASRGSGTTTATTIDGRFPACPMSGGRDVVSLP